MPTRSATRKTWNAHLTGDPDAFDRALDEWTTYFDELA
jgi:hypothetical protein